MQLVSGLYQGVEMNKRIVLGVVLSILALLVAVRLLIWTAAAALYLLAFLVLFALGIAVGWLLHGYKTYRAGKEKNEHKAAA